MSRNEQENLVQKIRAQYTEKERTELDALKELDKKVKKPADLFGWSFGSLAALIMGAGMSLIMTDIGAAVGLSATMLPGVAVGVVGMLMAIVNYPVYKSILNARRRQYAAEILALSDSIVNG